MHETPDELRARVQRETLAHTDDDVLARSWRLKQRFFHVLTSPAMQRFESDFEAIVSSTRGAHVLDLGCGRGEQAIALLKAGADVTGIDVSERYVREAERSVIEAGLTNPSYRFLVMDAHDLKFPEGSFDFVLGRGILHHLDIFEALKEALRVLRPGGTAAFQEPLGDNPLLKMFRALTPRARTKDERPLTSGDLCLLGKHWETEFKYYGLVTAPAAMATSILLRPFPNNPVLTAADWLERKLNFVRALQPWNQYVLMKLVRRIDSLHLPSS